MDIVDVLLKNKDRAINFMLSRAREEILQQGYFTTGKLNDSLRAEIETEIDAVVFNFRSVDYGQKLNDGVKASDLNFQKHFDDIYKWTGIKFEFKNNKDRVRFAYNVTKKHLKEGIPTKSSLKFSKNGRRTGWVKYSYEVSAAEFMQILNLGQTIRSIITNGLLKDIN